MNGRKWFIVTDAAGLLITVAILAATWQNRDGGKAALLGACLTMSQRCLWTRGLSSSLGRCS
ncbi:hypothetical protein COUCH_01750 [Couchioplanes caeruleus]|uniref:hypothetical protein n=1 Tax=Couchioplanes caeruleus TaxID=56438 RepID=UPI0020C0F78E|nr:hypothetical protein [Couchioplanes caeruleus]UQU65106.1 hypothetical protein COUCH_01750 [Couchioplanes caeruleus]